MLHSGLRRLTTLTTIQQCCKDCSDLRAELTLTAVVEKGMVLEKGDDELSFNLHVGCPNRDVTKADKALDRIKSQVYRDL